MAKVFEAVYEGGDLHPTSPLGLPERARVKVAIIDDLSASEIAEAAQSGGAFDFLKLQDEDIYSISDGEPV